MSSRKCRVHSDELDFYCKNEECKCFICSQCMGTQHTGHSLLHIKHFIKEFADSQDNEISTLDHALVEDTSKLCTLRARYKEYLVKAEMNKREVLATMEDLVARLKIDWVQRINEENATVASLLSSFASEHGQLKRYFEEMRHSLEENKAFLTAAAENKAYGEFIDRYTSFRPVDKPVLATFCGPSFYGKVIEQLDLHIQASQSRAQSWLSTFRLRCQELVQGETNAELAKACEKYSKEQAQLRIETQALAAQCQTLSTESKKLQEALTSQQLHYAELRKKYAHVKEASIPAQTLEISEELLKGLRGLSQEVSDKVTRRVDELSAEVKAGQERAATLKAHSESAEAAGIGAQIQELAKTLNNGLSETAKQTEATVGKLQTIEGEIASLSKSARTHAEALTNVQSIASAVQSACLPVKFKLELNRHEQLCKFESLEQLFGTADVTSKMDPAGLTSIQFVFDSKPTGKYIAFNMGKTPKRLTRMRMWSSGVSNNTYSIEYSLDGTNWRQATVYTHSNGWGDCKLFQSEPYPLWRIVLTGYGRSSPNYAVEWYSLPTYEINMLVDSSS